MRRFLPLVLNQPSISRDSHDGLFSCAVRTHRPAFCLLADFNRRLPYTIESAAGAKNKSAPDVLQNTEQHANIDVPNPFTPAPQPRTPGVGNPFQTQTDYFGSVSGWSNDKNDPLSGNSVSPPPSSSTYFKESNQGLPQQKWKVTPQPKSNYGLQNAIGAANNEDDAQDIIWVGTLGMPTDAISSTESFHEVTDSLEHEYGCLTVTCKDKDYDYFYSRYCKHVLWPILHYQIPDNPRSKAYQDHSWEYYVKVNQLFADKIVRNWKQGDLIWIHDYHLFLVPSLIRKKLRSAKIGFFLHASFPSSDVFRCLPNRIQLLESLLDANIIGFQIQEYCDHFLHTCHRLLCVEASKNVIHLEDHSVNIFNIPMGVDPSTLSSDRDNPSIEEWIKTMNEHYRGMKLIVARDKLDPVQGLRHKMLAYEQFLNHYPEWRGKVCFLKQPGFVMAKPSIGRLDTDLHLHCEASGT